MYIRMYVTLSINSNRNRVKAEKKEERKKEDIYLGHEERGNAMERSESDS